MGLTMVTNLEDGLVTFLWPLRLCDGMVPVNWSLHLALLQHGHILITSEEHKVVCPPSLIFLGDSCGSAFSCHGHIVSEHIMVCINIYSDATFVIAIKTVITFIIAIKTVITFIIAIKTETAAN